MCHAHNEELKKINNGTKRTAKSRKPQNFGEKENYKYLEILEADTIKQVQMKEKITRRISQTNIKASRN